MTDCVFCKIVKGEIPCYKIYEDEWTLAFLDIANDIEGHTLVIPKKHYGKIFADCPKDAVSHIMDTIQLVSKHYIDLGYDSVNVLNINELVEHLHFHLLPRKKGDGVNVLSVTKKDGAALAEVCEKLRLN